MKLSVNKWLFIGFVFTVAFGTLLHFIYEWSDKMALVAPFSNVNESTWEHMKLLFFPTFIFAIIQSFFFKDRKDYWYIKLKGTLLGLILIPVLYYLFNGIIGKSPDWINIIIFIISVAAVYIYESKLFKENKQMYMTNRNAIIAFCLVAIMFGIFTFYTPEMGIFLDPTTNTYGR